MSQFQPPSQPGWGQPEPEQPPYIEPGQYQQPLQQQGYYPPQQPPYYPPQQQQWQQPPMMPMQFQQPPKKKTGRMLGIGCGVLVALIVLIAVIVAATGNHGSVSTSTTPGGTQSTPTNRPTQAANKIGASVPSGTWMVTVNSVKTDPGDGVINTPKAGNVYLVVNVTVKNGDTSAQAASSLVQWKLLDSQGQSYVQDIAFGGSSPDGTVVAGQQLRGNIAYEVPKSIHQFTLQFEPSFDGSQIVQWTVSM